MLKPLTLALLLAGGLSGLPLSPAAAQQPAPVSEADIFAPVAEPAAPAANPNATQNQVPAQKPAKKTKLAAQTQKPAATAPAAGGEVEQRLQQLEEQIADMQVSVGTMDSLGKGRAGSVAPVASGGGENDIRIGQLETQMQGLNAQLADLANQMRALEQRLQSGAVTPLKSAAPRQTGAVTPAPGKPATATGMIGEQPAAADTGFGQTVVQPGAGGQDLPPLEETAALDPPIAQVPAAPARIHPLPPVAAQPQASAPATTPQVASLTPPSNDPQTAYDLAYGLILQQDYNGAEAAFRDYLDRFAQSPLASNAHYWYGQSFYARGQYKPAADAFLRGYKAYRTGQKAPDSLLKVGMSLSRLGQKDLACSALTALDGEFPNAPAQVKHLAQTERERAGC